MTRFLHLTPLRSKNSDFAPSTPENQAKCTPLPIFVSKLGGIFRKSRQSYIKIDGFFNEINPFRICEMSFGREILLRNVKYALRRVRIYFISQKTKFSISQFTK